jgi:hypothetical protein
MNQNTENTNIIYVYKSYTPAQAEANKRYYQKNRDYLLDYHRQYKKMMYENNEEFREKMKQRQRERYLKKKEMLEANKESTL